MTNGERFYREFVKAVDTSDITLADYRQGGSVFTEQIMQVIETVLRDSFGWETGREYFRVDVVGWKGRYREVEAEAGQCRVNPHLWDLMAAVEHENDPKDWTDELIKLAHINCPLRVVIGYSPCDGREGPEQRKLELAASWLGKTRAFSGDSGEYLLIFGNSAPVESGVGYREFDYRGYRYDPASGHFVRIEV